MTETGKNWHKKLPPTLYAYARANTFNPSCFKVSDKVDDGIMKEALLDLYTISGKRKPDQIIIFRDGACKFLDEKLNPKDCGYCCTKNHLTKFFQQGSSDNVLHGTVIGNKEHHNHIFVAPDNVPTSVLSDNVLHGTVIDNKVCHPKNNDFYLGTHAGMIGITRQTHYHVLLDQAGFSADDLQEFVHSLSYMYQRSTTAIFVVSPIYYAHLAASQFGAIYED
ncbi:hypothetical protein GOBAR_AA34266 [Gossypium barbadense]|uniref:Piwi domain-containing protein n=1 Tax=Gossypium barbadense TaxID=3634 RepID=A0A2P5W5S5_GOSBA|nr:hypothetical protein GOBAR_AA34266 [Gossypium barbadense]